MAMKKIDLLNQRFGRLVVIASVPGNWLCRCDCGKEKIFRGVNLRLKKTTSCGCLKKELLAARSSHNMSESSTYRTWRNMLQRCENEKNPHYKSYGARGIIVCDQWKIYANFLKDMGVRPKNTTLDRIDNDGNYELKNCRWATSKQQSRNHSRNLTFVINGEQKTLIDWCEQHQIKYKTAHARIRCGFSIEESLEITPNERLRTSARTAATRNAQS